MGPCTSTCININVWWWLFKAVGGLFCKSWQGNSNATDFRCITVEYTCTLLNIIWNEASLRFFQNTNSQKTLHTSPFRASYGASFLNSLEKRYHEISRVHCKQYRAVLDTWWVGEMAIWTTRPVSSTDAITVCWLTLTINMSQLPG